MLRALWVWPIAIVSGLLYGAAAALIGARDHADRIQRGWCRLISRLCGARVVLDGTERLPAGNHFVVVSNHESAIDPAVLIAELPRRLRFLAKRAIFQLPIFGWGMARIGHVAVNRTDKTKAATALSQAVRAVRDQDAALFFFPEGTRSTDGSLLPFKWGAVQAALENGAPIVPVGIAGTREVLPKHAWSPRPGPVALSIGAPIETAGYTRATRDALMARVREAVDAQRGRARALLKQESRERPGATGQEASSP